VRLTGEHITAALRAAGAGSGTVASPQVIADLFNDAIEKYGDGLFTTINTYAALVSECMMESAYFRTTREYSNSGSYQPYRGRTFIQLTWKDNYAAFGKWCKDEGLVSSADYFVKNPTKLEELKWAALGGVWYFTKKMFSGKPLTAYSDNMLQVGRAVNMGNPFSSHTPNGQKARDDAYRAVVKALQQEDDVAITADDIKKITAAVVAEIMSPDNLNKIADAVINRDAVPNEWDDKDGNPTISAKTSLRRADKLLRSVADLLAPAADVPVDPAMPNADTLR
jgi:hypothetical protein